MMIVLVGFMGCGKTLVGRTLAQRLVIPFVDLDEKIVERLGLPVSEIFSRFGEERFRREESRLLAETLNGDPAVIAAGGGAFCREDNRIAMSRAGAVTVFLDVPWNVLLQRVLPESAGRPKFVDAAQAKQLFEKRYADYLLARVHLTLTGRESPDEVAASIVEKLAAVA